MCGKFTQSMTYAQVVEYARAFTPLDAVTTATVTPMREAFIIRL